MASNEDLITSSIAEILGTDETLNLLQISDSLDNINGEVVGSDKDYGMNYNYMFIGMSGQRLLDYFNSNFHATDAQFAAQGQLLTVCIMSNTIKLLKEENGIVYYSTDGETWNSFQASWGKIGGNIINQKDLQEALSKFALSKDLDITNTNLNTVSNSVVVLQGNVTDINNSINDLFNQVNGTDGILIKINDLQNIVAKKISSDDIVKLRVVNGTSVEFTLDGTTWIPVSDVGTIEWGNIEGDIQNQADLINLINSITGDYTQFAESISDLISKTDSIQTQLASFMQSQAQTNVDLYDRLDKSSASVTYDEYMALIDEDKINDNTVYIVDDTVRPVEE